MKHALIVLVAIAAATVLQAQAPPDVATPEQREAVRRISEVRVTASKGKTADLPQLFDVVRAGVAADRSCERLSSLCPAKVAAADLLITWIENWNCQEATTEAGKAHVAELKTRLEALGVGASATGNISQAAHGLGKRLQDALDKLERCRAPMWSGPSGSVWFASVAPDMPSHEKEHWMVNCGPTPLGRWTIMRTEGPAAAAHEILGGVLDMKENGRGQYSLTGIGKSNQRGNYRETGEAELSELPGAPGMYMIVLRGTWSDRVADGRGGWVAKNFRFGDISFGVERRNMACPVKQ